MDQYIVAGITSFSCVLLYYLFIKRRYGFLIVNNKKHKKIKNELCKPNLEKSKKEKKQRQLAKLENNTNMKSIENRVKAKREFMLLWCYLTVMITNLIYLLLERFLTIGVKNRCDSFDINSLIIAILMIISSGVMWLLLKGKNTGSSRTKLSINEELSFKMTCSYIISTFTVIINLLIVGLHGAAYSWFLVLVGKFVWFDSYKLFNINKQILIEPFRDKEFRQITILAVSVYIATTMSFNFGFKNISLIMTTLGFTLFIAGIITVIAGLILLKKEKDNG